MGYYNGMATGMMVGAAANYGAMCPYGCIINGFCGSQQACATAAMFTWIVIFSICGCICVMFAVGACKNVRRSDEDWKSDSFRSNDS